MESSYKAVREATRSRHEALEALGFFLALSEQRLPRQSIVSYLRGMATIHAAVETALLRAVGTDYGPWHRQHARLDDVLVTLSNAGAESLLDLPDAVEAAIALADSILLDSDCPAALLGHYYVLEGSRLGGQVLCPHIAAALKVEPGKVIYCSQGSRALQSRWSNFKRALNALDLEEYDLERMISAAQVSFDGIGRLAENCYPYDPDKLRHRVTAINPEAGRHAMPQSEEEIIRALRCAQSAWQRFPYLDARYGERGRRFTLSDSCWLVTLYDLDESSVLISLLWLRRVLASRGLPTLILESHLDIIDRDIALENPERAQAASGYRAAISQFQRERNALLPPKIRNELLLKFERHLGQCQGNTIPGAGEILIGARIDTGIGIEHAWNGVYAWMTDQQRFSRQWIETVRQLAEELEAALEHFGTKVAH